MRVKATIETIQVLALQGLGFRGHDESSTSLNQGNLIELLKFKERGNDALESIIFKNAPQNAKYTSPKIQKDILYILADRVRNMIFDEVARGYFCILVDESQDKSKKEQTALILRYVKNDGLLGERFFDIMGVKNTYALTLKKEISNILSQFNLPIQNMHDQGYDGASNMRGEWNGLQALFLKDCPYAYYVHYFAHRLQLALIAAAKDKPNVWQFFSHLSCIVNLVASSSKRLGELKSFHRSEVENMLASGERQSSKWANQIGTLHRAGATRWSLHYESVRNLIDIYDASCVVVESLNKSTNQQIRGQANGVYKVMKSFEFTFILHLVDNILGIMNALCQALQQKTQDILNVMKLVSTTKALLQKLRQDDWDTFLANVVSFCNRHNIAMHDMSSPYERGTSCRRQQDHIIIEHHYHFDIFSSTIDFQLIELEHRFNDGVVKLLSLSSPLDPSGNFNLLMWIIFAILPRNVIPKISLLRTSML
ncbi:zinc finger MYM-type protein 1-like [Camellia sinensis]|uniref:zinc finger MYM-type protein 1-like n=1 Tax=Camellia sinensis TaxID=4442 RepID=UPI00103684F4|nr:zinc finger MYM-type protein 1-like [Camellia sinensis]